MLSEVEPQQYQRRAAKVVAVRWDGTATGATPIIDWVLREGGTAQWVCTHVGADGLCPQSDEMHHLSVRTVRGAAANAWRGWFVVQDAAGEFRAMDPVMFAHTYELVES